MQISFLTKEDVPSVLAVYAPYIEKTTITFEEEVPAFAAFEKRITGIAERFPFLVAKEGDTLLGYAYLSPYAERSAYRYTADVSIYLDENARGRGIGSALLEALEAEGKARGFRVLISVITEENAASRRFHEKHGYRAAGLLRAVGVKFGRTLDVSLYEKIL